MRYLYLLITGFIVSSEVSAYAAEDSLVGSSIKTFSILILIIILLFTLAWALKKYGPIAKVKKSLGLEIIGQLSLGAKTNLALVRVGKSVLLLGVTQNNISLIKDLSEGDFEKALDALNTTQVIK